MPQGVTSGYPKHRLAVADQGPVLPLPGRGLVGLGDHVQDQEFGQDLGIRRSVLLVLSAITLSFLGLASTTFSAKGSTSSTNQT